MEDPSFPALSSSTGHDIKFLSHEATSRNELFSRMACCRQHCFQSFSSGDTVDRIYYVNMSVLCMSWGVRCLRDSRKRLEYVGRGRKQTIPNIWKYFTNDSRFRDVFLVFLGSSGHTILQWVFNAIEFYFLKWQFTQKEFQNVLPLIIFETIWIFLSFWIYFIYI